MEVTRYKHVLIFVIILITVDGRSNNKSHVENTTHNCPFTRIIEDIFNTNKSSLNGPYWKERDGNLLVNASNFFASNQNISKTIQDELVSDIIASIKRIKDNLSTTGNNKLNEAIILTSKDKEGTKHLEKRVNIKSGIEDKVDIQISEPKHNSEPKINKPAESLDKTAYVEILTIEPNNTKSKSHSILDILKNLMPKLNASVTKDLHSITIIEKNLNKNLSVSETKNISTILINYCDKENITKSINTREVGVKNDDGIKSVNHDSLEDDYVVDDDDEYDDVGDDKSLNTSLSDSRREVLEAAEYGMQKMQELYGVLEPKLYSMGLVLNEKDPARYVAAFNAPSEEAARYAKYGYASLQASAKFRELASNDNDHLESRTEESLFPDASALRQSPLLDECPLRGSPKCPPASKRYRTHDGTCNNLSRPRWGSTMTPVQRFLPPVYSDGIQAPRKSVFGSNLPSAREISALIHEDKNAENLGITHLLMQWGQFLDHDITATSQSRGFNGSVPRCCKDGGRDFIPKEFMHPECLPIAVPPSDPFFSVRGVRCLDFVRSSPAAREECALGWREQANHVSAYIDASPLYASAARQSDGLRLFRNGMLQYGRVNQRRPLLPPDRDELCRGGAVSTDCFKSGDARVNEHPGLVAKHIVWLRQHNRMAQELAHLNPHWSDEKIYQETRKIVGAMIQHITYREFLPVVLGPEVMHLFELELLAKGYYRGYRAKTNASPASSFGSAAFRFGHSLVQSSMMRFDKFHRPINNNVSLHAELTNPSNIWSMGAVDRVLLGMLNQPIQKRDEFITEELTNHLFQTNHFNFGMDLAAINIQRGRDHGVPPYTAWREPCGLTPITSFDDLVRVMPARVVRKFKKLYRHVDDIDLFSGGVCERGVSGALVGPVFACIIAQQFTNLRKGDRFWYENGGFESSFTPAQLQQIRRISLAQVLCGTLDSIDNIQPFAFLSPNNEDNGRISCRNGLLNNFDLSPWIELHSDSNNIRKSEEDSPTAKLKKPKLTTAKPTTSTKAQKLTQSLIQQKSEKLGRLNITDSHNTKDSNKTSTHTRPKLTVAIDDKLDFRNKSRRYTDFDNESDRNSNRQYNNDYYDDVQSVQSVVINNLPNKRPNRRPYISVTENIDKYTYLINYVPRPTQSWRQTTRRNYDRDVVKVTYQTYDDTYRRPNRPYFNRDELDNDFESRQGRPHAPVTENSQSSARSIDNDFSSSQVKLSTKSSVLTERPKLTDVTDKTDPTIENIYKLLTFGYVGTYRHDKITDDKITDDGRKTDSQNDNISKDFSTTETNKTENDDANSKLSTFIIYDTATKAYNSQRPTRRNDDTLTTDKKDKYYFIRNVLHKYPDPKTDGTDPKKETNENSKTLNNTDLDIQERSGTDSLDAEELKVQRPKLKSRKPLGSAKTPSVAFQVIPSENSPLHWAVYEEKEDLPEQILQMPSIQVDPHALRELPRPMDFSLRRRHG